MTKHMTEIQKRAKAKHEYYMANKDKWAKYAKNKAKKVPQKELTTKWNFADGDITDVEVKTERKVIKRHAYLVNGILYLASDISATTAYQCYDCDELHSYEDDAAECCKDEELM